MIALVLALLLPGTFHTVTELEQWQADWATRADYSLSPDLMVEFQDMRERHLWYFDPQPDPQPAPTVLVLPTPATGAPSPPVNSGMGSNVEQWRSLVAAYFPADQVDRALRIMACESGGNPNAYNRSGASGLMQVLASWADNFGYAPSQLFDPAVNLHVASILYYDGGWGHWVCRG